MVMRARCDPWPTHPAPGSVALVTGGTGGFGRALATKLRALDVTAVLADLDSERNRQVAADLGCPFVVLDVTDRAANEAVVAQVEAEHGRLDAAYLNAGIAGCESDDSSTSTSSCGWSTSTCSASSTAPRPPCPALKRAGGGAIVVTASLAGLSPMATDPGYSVAKGGAVAFVRSMAPRLDRREHHHHRHLPRVRRHRDHRPDPRGVREGRLPGAHRRRGRRRDGRGLDARRSRARPTSSSPGIGAVPYKFKGVPSAKTEAGETAVVPEALRPPSMR